MEAIYQDIAERTDGDIYIGVVGPVRTGKSTFIKKFMDLLVIPNIENAYKKERARDELPQSGAGRTVMTTEPKFIPNEAVEITLSGNAKLNVRMIDCVGYIVDGAIGYIENEQPRMVMTPWFENEIPFNKAAEIGTKKVITEHSTIGLVVTTDGSITDISRGDYVEAEERVIKELSDINKPFIVILNSVAPQSERCQALRAELEKKYGVCVVALNCAELTVRDIEDIMESVLYEFPIKEIGINVPRWIDALEGDHYLKSGLFETIRQSMRGVTKISEAKNVTLAIAENEFVAKTNITNISLGDGTMLLEVSTVDGLFYKILSDSTGFEIDDEEKLLRLLQELAADKKEYDKIKYALHCVKETGYGVVSPSIEELALEEPEIVKQGGRYGVRLRASAPSIHMLRADIETEVAPIVGTEKQSEELIHYLLDEFETDPTKIWSSNLFGKSLHELVNEDLNNKLSRMPQDAQYKLRETLQRIINEGSGGLICIIL